VLVTYTDVILPEAAREVTHRILHALHVLLHGEELLSDYLEQILALLHLVREQLGQALLRALKLGELVESALKFTRGCGEVLAL
jgi:hypothetical protein